VTPVLLRFADFELDPLRYELRRNGRPLKLEKIPMELLQLLAESDGRLVTREEIEARLWGQHVFVDAEHGINTAVRKIRQVLGDAPDQPRFVQTVQRKGYRFVAEVRREMAGSSALPAVSHGLARTAPLQAPPSVGEFTSERPRADQTTFWSKRAWLAVSAGVVLLAAWPTYRLAVSRLATAASAPPMIRSIAVLPLDNLSGDASQEYFADGMTDELITMLAKYRSLRVISRTSAMQYKKTKKSLPEIARELSVDGIVEGSISRSHDKLRVTAQLVYGPTDTHLWAESYSRELSDALLLQHDLAKDIAARVNAASGGAAASVRRPAGNAAARDAYFHGRYEWFSQHYPKSRELFQEAIRLDPKYAAAYSGLADSYTAAVASGLESPAEVRPLAEAAAQKALELDDTAPEAHHAMAAVSYFFRWDWPAAERECLRTIELNPSLAETHHLYAYVLGTEGRTEESLQQDKIAWELDPFARPWAYGYGLTRARRFDEAIQELRQRAAARSDSPELRWFLIDAYEYKGDNEAAMREVRIAVRQDSELAARVERAYQRGGMPAVHVQFLIGMKEALGKGKYVSPTYMAEQAALAGLRLEALRYLQKAYEQRDAHLVHLEQDPAFDALREDAAFKVIAIEMRLPEVEKLGS
jgi:TolB-like protein/DNA-binding winged helix-turn-helix (wHTH) protein/Tfp pilus assembly protein PilF